MEEFGAEFLPKNKFNFPLKLVSTEMPVGIECEVDVSAQLKSAVILANGAQIKAEDLGFFDHQEESVELNVNLRQVREKAESMAIEKAYALADGNMSKCSELLGITRPTLYSLIDKYNLNINH